VKFAQALAELDSRQPERMIPDLDRITTLSRVLDDPQRTYPTIHVTGTNGKTTTSSACLRPRTDDGAVHLAASRVRHRADIDLW
jgi:folylpolyglutamate synthase/dihydropteroate synthase